MSSPHAGSASPDCSHSASSCGRSPPAEDPADDDDDCQQQQHQRELCRLRVMRQRERESVDERVQRLETERLRAAARRRNETASERETRRLKGRLRALRRRASETEEERARRKEQNRVRMARRRRMLKAARTAAPVAAVAALAVAGRPDPLPTMPLPLAGAAAWGHPSIAPLIRGLGANPPGLVAPLPTTHMAGGVAAVAAAAAALSVVVPEPPPPLAMAPMPGYPAAQLGRQWVVNNSMRVAFDPAVMAPRMAEQPLATAAVMQATAASMTSLAQGLVARIPLLPPPPLAGISTSLAAAIASASYAQPPAQYPQSHPRPLLAGVGGLGLTAATAAAVAAAAAAAAQSRPPPTTATAAAMSLPTHHNHHHNQFGGHYFLPP
ncbi:hypothetical protein IWQ57_000015 [Coemansia nantahalensis]|uniref:Uncharacterized protein n=2 Tax=Coemansia TaxID=4863 RepID=A0ACC1K8S5_9FUNG|nr:hypothetical protein IWQ57_000015 [Coemansia nantahalensis]